MSATGQGDGTQEVPEKQDDTVRTFLNNRMFYCSNCTSMVVGW